MHTHPTPPAKPEPVISRPNHQKIGSNQTENKREKHTTGATLPKCAIYTKHIRSLTLAEHYGEWCTADQRITKRMHNYGAWAAVTAHTPPPPLNRLLPSAAAEGMMKNSPSI